MSFLISGGYAKNATELGGEERFDFWREIICDEFVKLDCEKIADDDFNGELRGGVAVGNLQFAEVMSSPQLVERSKKQISKSTEADFLISFQIEKQGLVRQNGREALLTPGSFALYDSTQPYTLAFNEQFHQLIVQMPKDVLSRHLMNPEQYTAIPISGQAGLGAVLRNFVFSLAKELRNVQQAPAELSENLVNMIAMAFSSSIMLEQIGDHSVVRDSLKRRIVQYIDNNLCNSELSNQQVAEAQNISTRYLHKLFQGETETIHSLILTKRLEKSAMLLKDSAYAGHSIEKVAYSVGFSSPAHFSKAFKKYFGQSPSECRYDARWGAGK
ncbi:helix-turn-helix- domain containing protein, AraC type [Luminiphilus syltensis NOR5-1B]|uniref:Helix-turn-helix-domain containing protein, AraC type n=1 Tax=Luminiphilus syltensis NOR5-1B TaxID=565045 RepID=B8KVL0_9GAMM|nr:helix-turn-helix domain-containing protein [Luminiphilus syltensis]EED36765.1 helix-turn-helix- domain containing protein, AraC type [Luminiphilus syltensis NOR5-1B]